MRLELGKDSLLRPPSFVEENDLAWIGLVVGHDDELVSIFDGLKQIELNGSFVLASDVFSDEDEAIAGVPRLRLPAGLEITEPARHGTPSSSAFDHFFEVSALIEYTDSDDDLDRLNENQRIVLVSHRFAPQVTSAAL